MHKHPTWVAASQPEGTTRPRSFAFSRTPASDSIDCHTGKGATEDSVDDNESDASCLSFLDIAQTGPEEKRFK